jgi:hypothetical protein
MAIDIRINDVTTEVTVTDAAALLTPDVLEQIVQAVLRRIEEQRRAERQAGQERSLGSARSQSSQPGAP